WSRSPSCSEVNFTDREPLPRSQSLARHPCLVPTRLLASSAQEWS
ncbi:MAG: hypothetical protein AVDCRST_MAG33-3079, partial [uncultured Thermomicrobiales bacterium]